MFFCMCVLKKQSDCVSNMFLCSCVYVCVCTTAANVGVFHLCAEAGIGLSVSVKWGEERDDRCRDCERDG